jgi:phage terminase Nu1 subunit (DNA packaging protein)
MDYFADITDVIPLPPSGHGGARFGAGKKPAGYIKPQEVIDFDAARARNESAKAQMNELELKIKTGEYSSRASFRQATATAMAALAQTLRSVPDNLERKLGVAPETAAEVGAQIDAALNDIANEFQMMTSQHV